MRRPTRWLLLASGHACVAVGLVGAFLPVLPTTPFLLLAAYCYVRSSPTHYDRLLTSRLFGPILRDYHSGRGLSLRTKVGALVTLWASMAVSAWRVGHGSVLWVLLASGCVGSFFILRHKTKRRADNPEALRTPEPNEVQIGKSQ